jgi:hypothetical protein
MKTYVGGQIKEELRGEMALVITQDKNRSYDIFLVPVISEDFVQLTGVFASAYPVERVYAGISKRAGDEIASIHREIPNPEEVFRKIDNDLVYSYFLKD